MKAKRAIVCGTLIVTAALLAFANKRSAFGDEATGVVQVEDAQPAEVPPVPEPADVDSAAPSSETPSDTANDLPPSVVPQFAPIPSLFDAIPHGQRLFHSPNGYISNRYQIGTFAGDRYGLQDNGDVYANFLLPLYWPNADQHIFFVDVRGLANYDGKGGFSGGLGYRYFDEPHDRIFSLSGWVDYDDGHGRDYQQAGVSFESLGKWIDYRINGYIPFGRDSNALSSVFTGTSFFQGPNLFFNRRRVIESAYRGLDAEIGGPLPLLGRYGFSGYVGGYYRSSNDFPQASGVKVRFEANVTQDLQMSVGVSNDGMFGTNVWMNVALSLPDGRARRWFRPRPVRERLTDHVERNYRVLTHVEEVSDAVAAALSGGGGTAPLQPGGNPPLKFAFVDPQASGTSEGTFENPFRTLANYMAVPEAIRGDYGIILVSEATATNPTLGLDTGITLLDSQRLLSQAILPTIQLLPNGFTLQGFTPSPNAVRPVLSNINGSNVITIVNANNVEVAGFVIDGTTNTSLPNANGILGDGINGFNIHSNRFQNYRNAVVLTNATGIGKFRSNELLGAPGTSIDGFRLTNTDIGMLDLEIGALPLPGSRGNVAMGNDGTAFSVNATNGAEINVNITQNETFSEDRNSNRIFDAHLTEDANNNGILDPEEDLNRNGMLEIGLSEDVNRNGSLDAGEDIDEDVNKNGILDLGEDLNQDGFLNRGNGNGVLNLALTEDFNQNGILEPEEDLNGNGKLELAISEDVNQNGKLDVGEDVNEDVNNNGQLDIGEDLNDDGFLNRGNGNSELNVALSEDFNDNKQLDIGNGTSLALDATGTNSRITGTIVNNSFNNNRGEDRNLNGALDPGEDIDGDSILDLGMGIHVTANHATVDFHTLGEDFNGNGRLDGTEDLNKNNTLDFFVVEDRNANGLLDTEDVNGNRILDTEDLNGNGILDPGEDVNLNGLLDTEDVNRNGLLDIEDLNANGSLELALSEDVNKNGLLDTGEDNNEDLNGNGLLDSGEDVNEDTNGNGILDLGEDANADGLLNLGNSDGFLNRGNGNGVLNLAVTEDLNGNGRLDRGEDINGNGKLEVALTTVAPGSTISTAGGSIPIGRVLNGEDINGNGILDPGEDVNEDVNANGILDLGEDLNNDGVLNVGNGNGELNLALTEDFNGNERLDGPEDQNGDGVLTGGRVIANNTITRTNGDAVRVDATNDSTVSVRMVRNKIGDPKELSGQNGGIGLAMTADSGTIVADVGLLHYESEDLNGNEILDPGEDLNSNGKLDATDVNGNGAMDVPVPADGNLFVGNAGGGMSFDFNGTAQATVNVLNNTVQYEPNSLFNIDVVFDPTSTLTDRQRAQVLSAVRRWEQVLVGDLPDVGTIDDLQINLSTVAIDGVGNVLAQTALTAQRTGSLLPSQADLQLDTGDLATLEASGKLETVVQHELAHALGFGNVWTSRNLLVNGGTVDPRFAGALATAAYNKQFSDSASGVPVEGLPAGAGSIDTHWRESIFGNELMTPILQGPGTNEPIGGVTIAQFADIGYMVNMNQAQPVLRPAADGIRVRVADNAVLAPALFSGNKLADYSGNGMQFEASGNGTIQNAAVLNNLIAGNGTVDALGSHGSGISFHSLNSTNASITGFVIGNQFDRNPGNGLSVAADSGTINLTQITQNVIQSGRADGVALSTSLNGVLTTGLTNNVIQNNQGNGVSGIADTGTLTLAEISRNAVTGNGTNGITLGTRSTGTLTVLPSEDVNGNGALDPGEDLNGNGVLDLGLGNNIVGDNVANGIAVTANGGTLNLGTVANNAIRRETSGTDGIAIDITDAFLTGTFLQNTVIGDPTNNPPNEDLNANQILDAGEDLNSNGLLDMGVGTGIGFHLTSTGTLSEDVNVNGVLDPGEDLNANGVIDGLNNSFNVTVEDNVFDNNVGAGVDFALRQHAIGTFIVRNNDITRTQDDANPATLQAGDGIAVQMVGTTNLKNARGQLTDSVIERNGIGNADAAFGNAGHGIAFNVQEETTVRNLTIGQNNLILNNGGDGIHFERRDNAVVDNVQIVHNLIDSNGEDVNGNGALDAGEDRNSNGILDGDGIEIAALEGGRTVLGFTVEDNSITRNRTNGVHLHVASDARLNVDIRRNLIDRNSLSGILTTENFGHATDMREIGGEWVANRFTNNAAYGIRLDGTATSIFNQLEEHTNNIVDHITTNQLTIGGNLIDANGFDGIEMNGPGRLTIDSNVITNNGVNQALSTNTLDDDGSGIDIQSVMLDENGNVVAQSIEPEDMFSPTSTLEPRTAAPKYVEIFRNEIRDNALDGIEIRHANNPSSLHDAPLHPGHFPVTVVARENTIESNGGRGVDILNQGGARTPEFEDNLPPETGASNIVNPAPSATIPAPSTVASTSNQFSPTDTTVRLLDNKIASNGKEGVYAVNTASLTQGQAGDTPIPANPEDPPRGMNTDGEIDSVPRLALEVHHNLMIKNGQDLDVDAQSNPIDTITGSGLVLRVGTSDNEAPPLLIGPTGFTDYASAPGSPTAAIFDETGFRNADEILQATGATFSDIGFFNRLQPGGVIAKVTNNGLNPDGSIDTASGFEGNFGSDVYIESFQSTGTGAVYPVVARLDMIFEQNAGDSLDVTNLGAHFFSPRANGQRLASTVPLPIPVTLPLYGRIVGVHTDRIVDLSSDPVDDATNSSFFALDRSDPTASPLDDRASVYNGREVVMSAAPDTDADDSLVAAYGGLGAFVTGLGNRNSFTLQSPLPNVPQNGDPFRVEMSDSNIFDVALLSSDPRISTTATPLRGVVPTGALTGAFLVFIDELGVPDPQQPVRTQQVAIAGNFQTIFGQAATTTNPSIFHVQTGAFVDRFPPGSNTPQTGRGPVASNSNLPGLTGLSVLSKTSNQTVQVAPGGLTRAPRDGNLFAITNVAFGMGPSAFRVSGATVASQAQLGTTVDTNKFLSENLGFNDAVSLESGLPLGDELPFEWSTLPTANRSRILNIFNSLGPLPAPPVESFVDWLPSLLTFQR